MKVPTDPYAKDYSSERYMKQAKKHDDLTEEEQADKWENAGFVKASNYRTMVLIQLDKYPAVPSDIADRSEMPISHVSRALGRLRERGLVELLVDEDTRKGRIHGITRDGEIAVDTLFEMGVEP